MFKYIIIALLYSTAAQAEPFITFDNPGITREERLIKLQVEKHRESAFSMHVQGKCINNCAKPIDGSDPAIDIAQAKPGTSEEFETLVANINSTKMGENYAGR